MVTIIVIMRSPPPARGGRVIWELPRGWKKITTPTKHKPSQLLSRRRTSKRSLGILLYGGGAIDIY